jgi:hypothetical protein
MMHGGYYREAMVDETNVWMDMGMFGFVRWGRNVHSAEGASDRNALHIIEYLGLFVAERRCRWWLFPNM